MLATAAARLASQELGDRFRRPNSTSGLGRASCGVAWTAQIGTFHLTNGRPHSVADGTNTVATVPAIGASVELSMHLAALPAAAGRLEILQVRRVDANNFIAVSVDDVGRMKMYKVAGGSITATWYDSASPPAVAGSWVTLRALNGDDYQILHNFQSLGLQSNGGGSELSQPIGLQTNSVTPCVDRMIWRRL